MDRAYAITRPFLPAAPGRFLAGAHPALRAKRSPRAHWNGAAFCRELLRRRWLAADGWTAPRPASPSSSTALRV